MPILRGLGIAVLALCAGLAAAFAVAPYVDGPFGPIPGGPMSGPVANREPDGSSLESLWSLALQVNPEKPRSRTVWFVLVEGELYVPAGMAARKRWPAQAMADGRVVLRIGDVLYERQAVRVDDGERRAALHAALVEKYPVPDEDDPSTWFFHMTPRPRS